MQVERIGAAAEFLDRTSELRAADPVLTNLVGSIAQSVVDGRRFDESWWWLVSDATGRAVGCAMRTAPWNLTLGPMPVEAAIALGRAAATADPGLSGVTGPADAVSALVGALGSHRTARVTMRDVVHVLGRLVEPLAVSGRAVVADHSQLDLLAQWHEDFARDAGLKTYDPRPGIEQRLGLGALLWWQVDGSPVSLAGHSPPLSTPGGTVARVGPVFTPAPFRRHGYASALTAEVVRRLQPSCTVVMLFADAANATSNGVYERLGFRPTGEIIEVELDPRPS